MALAHTHNRFVFVYENFLLFIYLFWKFSVRQLFYTLLTDGKSSLVLFIYAPLSMQTVFPPKHSVLLLAAAVSLTVDQSNHV